MPFFAPVPWEAEKFFSQPGMEQKNFTLDWWPVGTGAYMLTENNPNARMVLERNPNFRGEVYPGEGEPEDAGTGLLADAGKTAALHRQAGVQPREGERSRTGTSSCRATTTPRASARTSSTRRCACRSRATPASRPRWRQRASASPHRSRPRSATSAFNWLDPVVGGQKGGESAQRARKLRHAHLDRVRRRGADLDLRQRPRHRGARTDRAGDLRLPRGQGRHQPVVYDWVDGKPAAQIDRGGAAGCSPRPAIPDGRDAKTGQPLVLYLDTVVRGAGRQGVVRLDAPPVREALDPARDPRHRLEPLPGEDPQGRHAALPPGLERRLSGPGELPVPAPRTAEPGQERRARTRATTPIRSSTRCSRR